MPAESNKSRRHAGLGPALNIIWFFLLPIICPVGLLVIWLIINARRDSRDADLVVRSLDWPRVHGTVIRSEVVWGHVDVVYEYLVEGKCHVGRYEISMTPRPADRYGRSATAFSEEAHDAMEDYPVGSTLVVRYNPNQPQESVLYYRESEITPYEEDEGF